MDRAFPDAPVHLDRSLDTLYMLLDRSLESLHGLCYDNDTLDQKERIASDTPGKLSFPLP
jgi:hypothetical protein